MTDKKYCEVEGRAEIRVRKSAIIETEHKSVWLLVKPEEKIIFSIYDCQCNRLSIWGSTVSEYMKTQYETLSWCGHLYIPISQAYPKFKITFADHKIHTVLLSQTEFASTDLDMPLGGTRKIQLFELPNQTEWAAHDRKIDPQIACIPTAVNSLIREYCQPYFIYNHNVYGCIIKGVPHVVTDNLVARFRLRPEARLNMQ